METSYGELKRKETVNLLDGKRLGRVSDIVFTWPEGRVQGIVVPGTKGFHFGKSELFIDLGCVKKIGVDVIFVEVRSAPKPDKRKGKWEDAGPPPPPPPPQYPRDRRDYGDYE